MDLGERYHQLSMLGRQTFLDSVAQGALVLDARPARIARGTAAGELHGRSFEAQRAETDPAETPVAASPMISGPIISELHPGRERFEIIPLCKKLGTPFVDLITLGRTPSNDITLPDRSVSRFQAFFRQRLGRWYVCDAGSRNGTRACGERLKTRTEVEVKAGDPLQFGTVSTVFHTADSLFDLLTHY